MNTELTTYLSDSEGDSVKSVWLQEVAVAQELWWLTFKEIPARGIVDCDSDLSIINGKPFDEAVLHAGLRKRELK